jgi:hypothetical protein
MQDMQRLANKKIWRLVMYVLLLYGHRLAGAQERSSASSDFLAPKKDLLLLEVAAIVLIDQHKVQRVAALEAIINIFVGGAEVCRGEVEADGDEFSLDGCAVHDLELAQSFVLSDCVLIGPDRLFPNDAQLHHLYLYAHQVEADLPQDAVFQMERLLREFELNVQALFYSHLHLDGVVLLGLNAQVLDEELLLFRDAVIVAIDHHVDEVAESHHDSVVRLELLLDAVKREVVRHVVRERAWRLQVTHQL